jgi:hypothetical protein
MSCARTHHPGRAVSRSRRPDMKLNGDAPRRRRRSTASTSYSHTAPTATSGARVHEAATAPGSRLRRLVEDLADLGDRQTDGPGLLGFQQLPALRQLRYPSLMARARQTSRRELIIGVSSAPS